MGSPIFVARLRITNAGGIWDSLNRGSLVQPRIVFDVVKSLSGTANRALIEVYNLHPDTVAKITQVVRTRLDWTPAERAELLAAGASADPAEIIADKFGLGSVELSWGYTDSESPDVEGALRVGFVGQTSTPRERVEGTDRILVIDATDGSHLLGAGEVVQRSGGGPSQYRSKSYSPGTNAADVIVDLCNSIGLSADRDQIEQLLAAALTARGLPPGDIVMSGGYTASGPAVVLLEQFLKSLELRWSIQDGSLLILSGTSVIPGLAPLQFSSEAGNIVGEPTPFEAQRLALSTWASTEALPGRQADVSTSKIAASFRVDQAQTRGDSYSGGQTDLRLDELQVIPGVV